VSLRITVVIPVAVTAFRAVSAVSVTAAQLVALLVTLSLSWPDVENAPPRPVTRA
jgi:hypothetical protein